MAVAKIENEWLRVEVNEPGVHPFVSLSLSGLERRRTRALLLGARQIRYHHKGASFPRLAVSGNEVESGPSAEVGVAPGGRAITFAEDRGGVRIESSITLEGERALLHVVHRLTPVADIRVNRVFDRYDFVMAQGPEGSGALDYWYVPHLRPKSDMVIGDHVFRSPVVMAQSGEVFFALIPDLELMETAYQESGARYYMDFEVSGGENQSPAASFGLGRTRVRGHVYFESDFQREFEAAGGRTLTVAYHLVLDRGGLGRGDVATFLWERYGHKRLAAGGPQAASLDRYAYAGLNRIFKKPDLFREFEIDGQPCGGTVAMHFANRRGVRLMDLGELRRYLRYQGIVLWATRGIIRAASDRHWSRLVERALYRYGPKVPPQIMFQSWFNNLRSAYGAYWFGRKWRDGELIERSLAVKNLAILAPREAGAFPAVCYAADGGLYWSKGTRGFKHVDWYHSADCATTGYYMTLWFADHEGDPRLIGRCHELAQFLLKAQLPSGAFPAWLLPAEPAPRSQPELRESATTACPAMFLAKLFTVESDPRYIEAAARACEFLASEVVPEQKWFDYETFYSCSQKKPGFFDHYTGRFPQNSMSMCWAAEALRLVHLATGDARFLSLGIEVLDHLCLHQQVWDPPFLSINGFGGFGSMNTDGEWNDSRTALMAPLLMDYYRLTGRADHMERGIAALRAAFTLMYIEENRLVAAGNMQDAPPGETGSVNENYGHFGYDHRVPGFLDSDWGAGSACQAAAYAQKHYGDVYVDLERGKAFGINGCTVKGFRLDGQGLSLDVEKHVEFPTEAVVTVAGAPPDLLLEVNGTSARRTPTGDFRVLL